MENEEQTTITTESTNQTKKQQLICEECKLNPWKYKCPGCYTKSCSIDCVKAHKQHTGCDGKRKITQFVPKSQFDDNLLVSDYNMLEDIKRVADSAQRKRLKICGQKYFKLPFHLQSLQKAANWRRTKLLFLSSGMAKREKNKSTYNPREKSISWTIEWRFHSTDVVLLDHGVCDNLILGSVIEKHLDPGPWNHKLKAFCDEKLESLKFFIRKYPKGAKSPFCELDVNSHISKQLANIIILEYPVIHVFLPSHDINFEVIKSVNRHPPKPVDYNPVVNGVAFKEEEIEDDDSSDPRVLDLKMDIRPEPGFQNPGQVSTENSKCEDGTPNCNLDSNNRGGGDDITNLDFEFDPDLLMAYSDLIEEINTGDFLDIEDEFGNDSDLDKPLDFGPLFPIDEGLEEGELPS